MPLELSAELMPVVANIAVATPSVAITLTVKNGSTHPVKNGGWWKVENNNTGPLSQQQVYFNSISPGASDTQTTYLTGGVDAGVFRFEAADGTGGWASFHLGNDVTQITLNLGDPPRPL